MEQVIALLEQLEADFKIGEESAALDVCMKILKEADFIDESTFEMLCNTIGTFSASHQPWLEPLKVRFSALDQQAQERCLNTWVAFLSFAETPWIDIKPYADINRLNASSLLLACLQAIDVPDDDWCRKALRAVEKSARKLPSGTPIGLAHAALVSHFGNPLHGLSIVGDAPFDEEWMETHLGLAFSFTRKAITDILKRFSKEIDQLQPDPNVEQYLPGNNQERVKDIKKAISKATNLMKRLDSLFP